MDFPEIELWIGDDGRLRFEIDDLRDDEARPVLSVERP
jgi:hypothetical protein